MNGDTRWVDLSHTRVSEVCSLLVALPSSRSVRSHSIRREEEGITISARTNDDCMSSETLDLTRDEVTSDDTTSTTIDDHDIEHFVASIELHSTLTDLTAQCRVGTEKELLPRLTTSIEGTRYLSPPEGAVIQETAVLTSERHTLSYTLVDDAIGYFS